MLLRTVHSVLNRTPPRLLKDIILVDDSSLYGMYRNSCSCFCSVFWVPDPKRVWHCFSIHEFIIYDKDILLREESIEGILMSTHESDVGLCGIILMVALRSSLVGHPWARAK